MGQRLVGEATRAQSDPPSSRPPARWPSLGSGRTGYTLATKRGTTIHSKKGTIALRSFFVYSHTDSTRLLVRLCVAVRIRIIYTSTADFPHLGRSAPGCWYRIPGERGPVIHAFQASAVPSHLCGEGVCCVLYRCCMQHSRWDTRHAHFFKSTTGTCPAVGFPPTRNNTPICKLHPTGRRGAVTLTTHQDIDCGR